MTRVFVVYLYDVFQALINSLVCWCCVSALGLVLFEICITQGGLKLDVTAHIDQSWRIVSWICAVWEYFSFLKKQAWMCYGLLIPKLNTDVLGYMICRSEDCSRCCSMCSRVVMFLWWKSACWTVICDICERTKNTGEPLIFKYKNVWSYGNVSCFFLSFFLPMLSLCRSTPKHAFFSLVHLFFCAITL